MATATLSKTKKTASSKPPSHPPFAEMISDAVACLKERTGSSQIAISKFIEEKHKHLPSTFKKLLLHNLKKSVAAGKLVKVKNSFKLAPTVKAAEVKKPKTVAKPKAAAAAASKDKPKAAAVKSKAVTKPKAKSVKSPTKKKVVAVKSVKKPKSVKSPVKKVAAKKAKK